PFQATLVPERRREITTEGGLALHGSDARVRAAIAPLTARDIRVSLFIDPDLRTIDRAAALGVPAIELHTGRYAQTWRKSDAALRALARAAAHARARGLAVHAGHGLTYQNVQPVAAIPEIEELNIGHSIVSNAIFWGMEEAVRRMRALVDEARERGAGSGTVARGALMAHQPATARAAAGLEALTRALRGGRRAWDPQTRQLALRGVDDLKIFVRQARAWTDADTVKAEGLAQELEQHAGRPSA